MNNRITRVRSLDLTRFRGFIGENIRVNTDADIVFLSGPNGVGKTSLIDALCLVLTNHYYKEREPLISYDNIESSIHADVVLNNNENTIIKTHLSRASAKGSATIKWGGESWLQKKGRINPLHARACFYYQDIIRYLFEEESGEAYLEDFLLASAVPVADIYQACKNGLFLIDDFVDKLYPQTTLEQERDITLKRVQYASRLEREIEKAASLISSILPELRPQGKAPTLNLTTKKNEMRVQWKEKLIDFINNYKRSLKIDSAQELTAQSTGETILKDLQNTFNKLFDQYRTDLQHSMSLQQSLEVFFRTGDVDCQIFLKSELLQKRELKKTKITDGLKLLNQKQSRVVKLLRDFESVTESGQSLEQVLIEMRRSGPAWIKAAKRKVGTLPKAVKDWLFVSMEMLDSEKPAVDEQLATWVQKQTDIRTTLGVEIEELVKKKEILEEEILKSKEFHEMLSQHPQLKERFPRELSETATVAGLAEILGEKMKDSMEDEGRLLSSIINTVDEWIMLERRAEELEQQKIADKTYKAMKGELEKLKHILKTESSSKTSTSEKLQLITPEKRDAFAKQVNNILQRFCLDLNASKIALSDARGRTRKGWKLKTKDNRVLSSLSSGQKSLLGIASLIALNSAMQNSLWADILAFDDFTSSLDLNQIPRLTCLLRQIAYGSGVSANSGAQIYKRQVFIVSHHEDLTNKLLDFLIPPPNHTMKIINFHKWSSQDSKSPGPIFDELNVSPSPSSAQDVIDRLPDLLDKEFSSLMKNSLI